MQSIEICYLCIYLKYLLNIIHYYTKCKEIQINLLKIITGITKQWFVAYDSETVIYDGN